jgi:Cu(I)/Ag(I) efflux system membrane fusion protein
VPQEVLDGLEKGGQVQKSLTLRSPVSGVVTVKNVVEGARISPSEVALEVTDLSRLWAYAEVYEPEISRVKVGLSATLTLDSVPGRSFTGQVSFVDPFLDAKTRTAKVRVEFANPGALLKPEMFGEITLKGAARKGILIPRDAVLEAGNNHVAFVSLGEGRFEPRELKVGANFGENLEVLSGLKAGEEVVTRANFLVDSESRLRAALAQMAAKPATGHGH